MKTIYITENQVKAIFESTTKARNAYILTEESGSLKKKVKNIIRQFCNPQLVQFLDTPLNELPREMKNELNPGGQETAMFASVKNNPTENKFIDFLKVNLYDQLGTRYKKGPWEYLVGAARILCDDLRYYWFDNSVRGGAIVKFSKIIRLIHNHPAFFLGGAQLDQNLNGMSYDQFIAMFGDKMKMFIKRQKDEANGLQVVEDHGYTITRVQDQVVPNRGAIPCGSGATLLNKLDNYTDWCICGELQSFEYPQYTGGGGAVYIMEKHGYENIPKEPTENCPLDDYGLSLICVIVGPDGLPDNITTRWNHENGGENPEGLLTAVDLQRVTGVKYFDTFKPRSEDELRNLHMIEEDSSKPSAMDQVHNKVNAGVMDAVTGCGTMEEGAEPESDEYSIGGEGGNNDYFHALNEEKKTKDEAITKYFEPLAKFMKGEGLNVAPFPKVKLNWDEQDGLFIKTGYYEPESKTITIFCAGRHPKDILRTFAHEMIHHSQNLDGVDLNFSSEDAVKDNDKLEEVESEAYLKGNVMFRKWTEHANKNEEILQEDKRWLMSESHYDEYYHFTEVENLISILQDKRFYLAGSSKNIKSSQYASKENAYRGGKNGYLSLTRMRSIEQGYQSSMAYGEKAKDAIARITFDGNVLNNINGVSIKPLDFIYNWNRHPEVGAFQDYSPKTMMRGGHSDYISRAIAKGRNGRGLYSDGDSNQAVISGYREFEKTLSPSQRESGYAQREIDKYNDIVKRQFQNQAEESLILTGGEGELDWKTVFLKAVKRIDILILNGDKTTFSKLIEEFGKLPLSDRTFIYPIQCKGYFNLGKQTGGKNVKALYDSYHAKETDAEFERVNNPNNWDLTKINGNFLEEGTDPEDIDLSSFNIKTALNPKFWKNERLDSRIRLKLLDIADDFIKFLGVDWVKPEDVIITGSLANFNWNKKFSDIDLHVVMDYSKVDKRKDFVDNYFYSQKKLWNDEHKDLKIFGFPVEVYVQDKNAKHSSTGVYSLDKDKWIVEPERDKLKDAKVNKSLIKNKVAEYIDKIEELLTIYKEADGDYKIREVSEKADKLFDKIKAERKNGLDDKDNEITNGNIIFKCLRRLGYIEKLSNLMSETYDKINSLS